MKLLNRAVNGCVLGLALGSLPIVASADPQISMHQEEAAHPKIAHAIHDLYDARADLNAAPDDFGGKKAAAIASIDHTIHALKAALYYRLKLDDAALDKIQ